MRRPSESAGAPNSHHQWDRTEGKIGGRKWGHSIPFGYQPPLYSILTSFPEHLSADSCLVVEINEIPKVRHFTHLYCSWEDIIFTHSFLVMAEYPTPLLIWSWYLNKVRSLSKSFTQGMCSFSIVSRWIVRTINWHYPVGYLPTREWLDEITIFTDITKGRDICLTNHYSCRC